MSWTVPSELLLTSCQLPNTLASCHAVHLPEAQPNCEALELGHVLCVITLTASELIAIGVCLF